MSILAPWLRAESSELLPKNNENMGNVKGAINTVNQGRRGMIHGGTREGARMENRGGWTTEAREAHASWKGKTVVEVSENNGERRGEIGIKANHPLRSQSSNHSVSGYGSNADVEKLADNIGKTDLFQNSGDEKDSTSNGDDLIEIPII